MFCATKVLSDILEQILWILFVCFAEPKGAVDCVSTNLQGLCWKIGIFRTNLFPPELLAPLRVLW